MIKNYLAKHYNKLILPLKPEVLTERENVLIQTMLSEHGKILDVGCGTGRHLIPLSNMGYQVIGVEANLEMAAQLLEQKTDTKLFLGNINSPELRKEIISDHQNYFDLIILMWNTLNELAYSEEELISLLHFFKSLVKTTGKILIQIDQNVIDNPEALNFATDYTDKEGNHFRYISQLREWNEKKYISTCDERLETDGEITLGEVTQKWWSFDEVNRYKDIVNITTI